MTVTARPTPQWLLPEDCRLEDLLVVLADRTRIEDHPHAAQVESEVVVYDADRLGPALADEDARRDVLAEVAYALSDGPGIVVVERAFAPDVVDRVTAAFEAMIASSVLPEQHAATTPRSPAPTTGSGTPSRSWRSPTPRRWSTATPTTSSHSPQPPGSAPATR